MAFFNPGQLNLRMEAGSGNARKGLIWTLRLPCAFLLKGGEHEKNTRGEDRGISGAKPAREGGYGDADVGERARDFRVVCQLS